NFLKFYYRIFNPNKETDFTPTIQQEDFLRRVGLNALLTLKPCKIPIIRTQSQNQTPPTLIFQPLKEHQRIKWCMLSCFDDPLAPIIDIRP
ncbi:hypothetical protein ACQKBJ_07615, partial [Helicobacter pylori]